MSDVVAAMAGGESRVECDRSTVGFDTPASTVAWRGISFLVLVAPFEASEPLLRLPGQSLSTVEAALLAVFTAWMAACVWSRVAPVWRTPLTRPWMMFAAAMLVAAIAAPDNRINALHMVGRFGLAFGVYLVTINGVTTPARLRGVLVAASVAGAIVGTLVLLDYLGVGPMFRWLHVFRADVARVGALIRAGGPFQYPTIASMYLEIVFALTLGLLLMAIDTARSVRVGAIAALLLVMSGAIMLTFTRSGLITMAASLAIVGARRMQQRGFDHGTTAIAVVAALIAIQLVGSRSIDDLRLRMTTEGQEEWYDATIEAPSRITIPVGGTITVPVTLTNSGLSRWDPAAANRFRLSYHWLLRDQDKVVSWEGLRTDFPSPVQPGERVRLQARVSAPRQAGEYRLLWDIEQENRLWFSTEPGAGLFFTGATVSGSAAGAFDTSRLMTLPQKAARPRRGVLWRAAARMVAAHPLIGVGPDNYRLLYGGYAGLASADPRVHSNNMYLEVLVGGGFAGGLAFAWLCWRAAEQFAGAARRAAGPQMAAAGAAVLAAGAAIAFHGLSDSFLGFTATYILIAITIGLAVAGNALNEAPCA
jgi:O-antigen ligase/polysaccharide polymerase Wzy-like membrane protein